MTQQWIPLARLARQYGLKTAQADEAAKKLGLNLRRGAAKVAPWQEKLLRPELARMKWEKERRQHTRPHAGPAVYEATDEHSGYADEVQRLGFSNSEMARQLAPVLKRLRDAETS